MLDLGHLTWVQGKYCQSYPPAECRQSERCRARSSALLYSGVGRSQGSIVHGGRSDESKNFGWKGDISYQLIMKLEVMEPVLQ